MNLKYYAPVLGLLSMGGVLFLVGGAMVSNSSPLDDNRPKTNRERIESASTMQQHDNVLKGKATINKTFAIPKGVLMVFIQNNDRDAAAYGRIDPNGEFSLHHVPEGPVRVVFRPDTESKIQISEMPRKGDARFQVERTGLNPEELRSGRLDKNRAKPICTEFTVFLDGLPKNDKALIYEALLKYGMPRSENAFKTMIASGVNIVDIDFQIP